MFGTIHSPDKALSARYIRDAKAMTGRLAQIPRQFGKNNVVLRKSHGPARRLERPWWLPVYWRYNQSNYIDQTAL